MTTTAVRGGLVVLPELAAPTRADIAIRDGRIVGLLEPGAPFEAERTIDASGLHVLPGGVDPHVHVAWPFRTSRTLDDHERATRAATLGGTTTFIDFAIEGREDPVACVAARRAQAEDGTVCDFSLHCVVSSPERAILEALPAVMAVGVTSFKMYLTYRDRGIYVDDGALETILAEIADLGGQAIVHAEVGALEDARVERLKALGHGEARHFPSSKPPYVEAEAVRRAARLAALTGANLGILHLSSGEGLDAALAGHAGGGQPSAVETCPQYLLLDDSRLSGPEGHRFLCSPPIRTPADNERLWQGIADGEVTMIGTDHCLFTTAQKDELRDVFWQCPHGHPGIETRMRLLLHHGLRRGIPITRLAAALGANAARFYGLYPRKGTLLPGSDADLALWDLDATTVLHTEDLHMGSDWTPFEGIEALGAPQTVLVRGALVVEGGESVAVAGSGEFVPREPRR
jgi:dihydropyrimidinase